MKKLAIASACLLLSSFAGAQSLQPLTVGILLPQSGVYANMGNALRNGATLSFQDTQAEFAKLGFDLKFKNFDDEGSPGIALNKASQIVSDPTVLVAIGPATSDSSMIVTPFFQRRDLAVVNPFSIENALTEKGWTNINRIVPRADTFTLAEADYVLDEMRAKNITLINNGSKLGVERTTMMSQHFKEAGAKVLDTVTVGPDSNFDAIAKGIVKDGPDTVHMAVSQYTVSGGMVNALRGAGYMGAIFTSAVLNPAFAKLTGDNYKGLFYVSNITTLNGYPKAALMTDAYRKQFKVEPLPISLIGYDAMDVALEGLRLAIKANKGNLPSRKDVQDAMKSISIKGFTGDISFSKAGDRLKSPIYVLQVGNDSLSRVVGAIQASPPKK